MDWFKVKAQHILDSELSDAEVGQLVRYQARIAFYERPLSNKEFNATFSPKKLQKISKFLSEKYEICLKKVLEKVLEDVEKNLIKSKKSHDRVRRFRLKLKENNDNKEVNVTRYTGVTCNANVTPLDKIREDNTNKNYYDNTLMSSSSFLEIFKDESFLQDPIGYCKKNISFCKKIAQIKCDSTKITKSKESLFSKLVSGMQGEYKGHEIESLIKQARNLAENEILEKDNAMIRAKEDKAREDDARAASDDRKRREEAFMSMSDDKKSELLQKALKNLKQVAPSVNFTLKSPMVKSEALSLI